MRKDKIEKLKGECLYCKRQISVICGTPLIYLSGCCYGYTDEKTKTRHIFGRKAHLECWFKEKKLKLIGAGEKK